MFVVTCPMRDDRLANALETIEARRAGFRPIASSVAIDATCELFGNLYPSRPSPADPWLRVFSENN